MRHSRNLPKRRSKNAWQDESVTENTTDLHNTPSRLIAKKSLGQNFLKNTHIINNIVLAGEISKGDIVVEIGPGAGALTAKILETIVDTEAKKLIAIEKDHRAIELLQEKYKEYIEKGIFVLIEGDFLEMDLGHITKDEQFILIGNIPYYITGSILRKSLESAHKPKRAVFLVQKEVAERIVCRNTTESILSQSIRIFGDAELLMHVSKGNFVPAPKVDSAVIRINAISDKKLVDAHITSQAFFDILHAGFAHKRKKMFSNIYEYLEKKVLHRDANEIKHILQQIFTICELSENSRAEELTHNQLILLVSKISSDIL